MRDVHSMILKNLAFAASEAEVHRHPLLINEIDMAFLPPLPFPTLNQDEVDCLHNWQFIGSMPYDAANPAVAAARLVPGYGFAFIAANAIGIFLKKEEVT